MTDNIVLSAETAQSMCNTGEALLIDVRDVEDYALEHIAGAVSVPDIFYHLTTTTAEELDSTYQKFEQILSAAGLKEDQTAILYEDALTSRFGGSCRGWWLLNHLGHKKTAILDKGFTAWKNAGLPTDNVAVVTTPGDFKVNVDNSILAVKEDVLTAIDNDDVVLLDNRDAREWFCEGSSPYDTDGVDFSPRRGRIPGAKWVEWHSLLDDSDAPTFKPAEQIVEILAAQGIQKEDDIIIYCFKGSRAGNTFAALKMAGFTRLRNYLGSWYEWSADDTLPIEVAESKVA